MGGLPAIYLNRHSEFFRKKDAGRGCSSGLVRVHYQNRFKISFNNGTTRVVVDLGPLYFHLERQLGVCLHQAPLNKVHLN